MTAIEFNKLTFAEKADIWGLGAIFLDERIIYGKYMILMYFYANFYIEVYYNVNNKIENLKALYKSNYGNCNEAILN